ncbi:protein SSUH2 homolog [Dendropsophus ebraccatus]|uniref:protein SSUH2 homolog n=1 Tax=Dendropsophus ebraccatus TaxID=150705 RepID=UPI003832061F
MEQPTDHKNVSSADKYKNFESTEKSNHGRLPTISEADARQAFLEYAKRHTGYSSTPAKEMSIENIKALKIYRYSLRTFYEERETAWKTCPYYGGEVDGPSNGTAPNPKNMRVYRPYWFVTGEKTIIVPHTSKVQLCICCAGKRMVPCPPLIVCMMCLGSGLYYPGRCFSCGGTGRVRCGLCFGRGRVRCIPCIGQGRMITFLQMKIKWKNHFDKFVSNRNSEFPSEKVDKVSGKTIFSDEDTLVRPVTAFSDPSINESFRNILKEHAKLSKHYKILRQHQKIELVPLSKVYYEWKGEHGAYYVYGVENKAYCDSYPKRCVIM